MPLTSLARWEEPVVLFLASTHRVRQVANFASTRICKHIQTVYMSGKGSGHRLWETGKQQHNPGDGCNSWGRSHQVCASMGLSEGRPRPACVHARHSWPSRAWLVSYILSASRDEEATSTVTWLIHSDVCSKDHIIHVGYHLHPIVLMGCHPHPEWDLGSELTRIKYSDKI